MPTHTSSLPLLVSLFAACTGLACSGGNGSGGAISSDGSSDDAQPARGDKALIYRAGTAISLGNGDLSFALQDAGAEVLDGPWPDALADYRILFLLDIGALGDDELQALQAFAANGGGVVVSGEPASNGTYGANLVLEALGSSMRLEGEMLSGCNSVDAVGGDPLIANTSSVSFSRGHSVSGGTALYSAGDATAIAVDGTIVAAGDSDTFLDGGCLGCCGRGEGDATFWTNLYRDLAD